VPDSYSKEPVEGPLTLKDSIHFSDRITGGSAPSIKIINEDSLNDSITLTQSPSPISSSGSSDSLTPISSAITPIPTPIHTPTSPIVDLVRERGVDFDSTPKAMPTSLPNTAN